MGCCKFSKSKIQKKIAHTNKKHWTSKPFKILRFNLGMHTCPHSPWIKRLHHKMWERRRILSIMIPPSLTVGYKIIRGLSNAIWPCDLLILLHLYSYFVHLYLFVCLWYFSLIARSDLKFYGHGKKRWMCLLCAYY